MNIWTHIREPRQAAGGHERGSLRVVAFGGGTGLPVLLRGLRETGVEDITAVVTVGDDGGSSGRLREQLGLAPPGDLRRCLVALAEREQLADVFEHRFTGGEELRDHSVGNILIAALSEMSGGFCEAVEQAGRFLGITGKVLPAATDAVTLVLQHSDGSVTHGESTPCDPDQALTAVRLETAGARAPGQVIEAVEEADVVLLSCGSLFTSTIASLLGAGVPEALARCDAPVVYVANAMTQPGETVGLTLSDHVNAIIEHVGPVLTDVLVDNSELPALLLAGYRAEGAERVVVDGERVEQLGVEVHLARLLSEPTGAQVRHDPARLAELVHRVALRSPHSRAMRSDRTPRVTPRRSTNRLASRAIA